MSSSPFDADVAVTHILVVSDAARSRDFWVDVLGAELYREYGGARDPDGHLVELSQAVG